MTLNAQLKARLRNDCAEAKIMSAKDAAKLIESGMVLGVSGFTPSGYPKAVPLALAERAKNGENLQVDLFSGASMGPEIDASMTEVGMINRRLPYQTNGTMRNAINAGRVKYMDLHLSQMPQYVHMGYLPKVDVAIIEAVAITEEGDLVLTTAVGSSPSFVAQADLVIVELALTKPVELEGMHDIYITEKPPHRKPIPIEKASDRIGSPYVKCGWDKIKAIVISEHIDKTRPLAEIKEDERKIGKNIIRFLKEEVKAGRLTNELLPLQSGVGSVANAVLYGLIDSEFKNLTCYTEVVQDSMLDLLRSGKATIASTTSVSPSPEGQEKFIEEIDFFRDKIIFRPVEISNNPEVARRLGVIAMNTALEVDIYGNVNSTHVMGKKIMNGIGGSGDFSRNAGISIFTTSSVAKGGLISSIVPMCPHVDHTEHEVMVIVTEQGYADLRGLSPKERAVRIIENCAHPDYRDQLMDYFNRACEASPCQTPHILSEALSWHTNYEKNGTMK
ncbi:MAG: acetyl-CoA hydrolase/transferase family protein [Firmicutes bacterium]|nr:acetyl-CoA hydrolase/transferase family protein [Bacillota bacterium]